MDAPTPGSEPTPASTPASTPAPGAASTPGSGSAPDPDPDPDPELASTPVPAPEDASPSKPPRRRLPWLVGIGGLLVGGLIGGLVVGGIAHHRDAPALELAREAGLITDGFPGGGGFLDGGGFPGGDDRPGGRFDDRHGPSGHRPWLPGPDGHAVVGSVVGSGDNSLTIAQDGAAETTIPTDADTRVRGVGNAELSDLDPGERVVVLVGPDGTATAIGVVPAHVVGTVTALNGDRATVVEPGGLAVPVDLSGVEQRPAVGTAVAVRGTAADQGGLLRAEEVREHP